jgi:ribosome-interacting GTPase 1
MTIFDEIEQQGIEKEKQITIIRSWQNGIAIPMISNITGLSIAEIEKVIANFQSRSQKSNL